MLLKRYKASTVVETLPKEPDTFVYAPSELIGASVQIDGVAMTHLYPERLIGRKRFFVLSRTLVPERAVALLCVEPGEHEVTIEKHGYAQVRQRFSRAVNEKSEIVIGDSLLRRV